MESTNRKNDTSRLSNYGLYGRITQWCERICDSTRVTMDFMLGLPIIKVRLSKYGLYARITQWCERICDSTRVIIYIFIYLSSYLSKTQIGRIDTSRL